MREGFPSRGNSAHSDKPAAMGMVDRSDRAATVAYFAGASEPIAMQRMGHRQTSSDAAPPRLDRAGMA